MPGHRPTIQFRCHGCGLRRAVYQGEDLPRPHRLGHWTRDDQGQPFCGTCSRKRLTVAGVQPPDPSPTRPGRMSRATLRAVIALGEQRAAAADGPSGCPRCGGAALRGLLTELRAALGKLGT